jgi:hypothetical protein
LDGSRFDAWTRRRFGLATGGAAVASLLGSIGVHEAEAKKKRKKKKKCRKLQQSCDQSNKKKKCCNKNQLCAQVSHLGSGNHCCKQRGQGCSEDADCCGSDRCDGNDTCQLPNS